MGVSDQIEQMRYQGISYSEIINSLKEQGISPREINDAINQIDLRNSSTEINNEEMSLPPSPDSQAYDQSMYDPRTQEYGNMYSQQEGYQDYGEYGNYSYADNTESTVEIAEQVFSEKTKEIINQIDSLNEFKSISKEKIENLSERIKRIETMIDNLQISILEKVGGYGKGLENTKKEMQMMQDSFGKMINNLADNSEKKHYYKK